MNEAANEILQIALSIARSKSGTATTARTEATTSLEQKFPLSNIPSSVPLHFLGRGDELAAIDGALKGENGRIAALYGMRGVGKSTLAAAFAERHRADYRATWWIRAQTPETMRADLVSLGVRLGWVAAGEKEEPALAAVRGRLRDESEGLLLIYDNAIDAASTRLYLPDRGAARALVTSNSPAWRGVATPVEIRVWPKEVGADYLIARTGRENERAEGEGLSTALGGLTLAHEQVAAYCERVGVSFAEYRTRFEAAPARLLDAVNDASADYHGGLTVAKAFALAIDEAAKMHPAAESLIAYAALLAPEPIPLFLFSEAREKFGEPLASQLADDGLDEAIAALRAFALVDRETIPDERDPSITTDAIRLHRLVRAVAATRLHGEAAETAGRVLTEVMAAVYPRTVYDDPIAWQRARRLDALALDLVGGAEPPNGAEMSAAYVLTVLAQYRQQALAAYSDAQPLFERAATIVEKTLGSEHSETAMSLDNLAGLLLAQGDVAGARPLFERALAIKEEALGPEHPNTAPSLNNLAFLLKTTGDLTGARPLYERALAINEKVHGPEHPLTARSLNNLASLLLADGDLIGARPLHERSLAICEKALGPEHPDTAASLVNLANVLRIQGDHARAQSLCERALTIYEKTLGPNHPDTNLTRANFARLRLDQGAPLEALALSEAALAAHDKVLGADHPRTKTSARVKADALGRADETAALRTRYGL